MLAASYRFGAGVALLALGACRSAPEAPPPLATPDLEGVARFVPGTTLGGAGAADASADSSTGEPLVLRCRMLYLEEVYDGGLEPLATGSALVADLLGERPFLPLAGLTAGGGYALGADALDWMEAVDAGGAGRTVLLDERTVYLPTGSTYSFEASATEPAADGTGATVQRGVALWLTWTPDGPRVSVSLDDLDPDLEAERRALALEAADAGEELPDLTEQDEVVRREVVVLTVAPARDEPLVLRLPSPFSTGEGRAFAAWVELLDESGEAEALASVADRVAAEAAAHAVNTAAFGVEDQDALHLRYALEALREADVGRPALLLLAGECGAVLTEDLALVADDEVLVTLVDRALDPEQAFPTGLDELAWRLESVAWTMLCTAALEEALAPELEGLLLRHAGALKNYPDVVLDAAAASADLDAFTDRLVTEQGYFLEDISPSARVRAHDWLDERGRAVPGYDPLASRDERRAALEPEIEEVEAEGEQAEEQAADEESEQ